MSEPMSPAPPPPGPPPAGGGGYQPPSVPGRPGLPWDLGKDVNSLIETAKRLITGPGQAYDDVKEKGDYGSPLIFAVVFIVIAAVLQAIWQIIGLGGSTAWLNQMGNLDPEMAEMMASMTAVSAGGAIMGIIWSLVGGIVGLFIAAAIFHLMLQILGGLKDSSAGFEGTFRVVSYAQVVQLAVLVPFVGGLIALVWGIIMYVLGLSSVHRTTQGKAVAAVLIPIVVCCVCIIIAAVMFAGAIMAAIGGAAGAAAN